MSYFRGLNPHLLHWQAYALLLHHLGSTCMAELATEILTVVIPKKCPVPELQLQQLLWLCSLNRPRLC